MILTSFASLAEKQNFLALTNRRQQKKNMIKLNWTLELTQEQFSGTSTNHVQHDKHY